MTAQHSSVEIQEHLHQQSDVESWCIHSHANVTMQAGRIMTAPTHVITHLRARQASICDHLNCAAAIPVHSS